MSNLWINWRFWCWHFQVIRRDDWSFYRTTGQPITKWTRNGAHARGGFARRGLWSPGESYQARALAWSIIAALALLIWIIA